MCYEKDCAKNLGIAFWFFILLFTDKVYSQKTSDIGTAYHRIIFESNDTLFQFYVTNPGKQFKPKDDEEYYWYNSDTILKTFGGFQGKLLDGPFTKNFPNRNLCVQEIYTLGLKNGESKTWYPDGKLMSVIQWVNGKKDGFFKEYDSVENLVRYGKYKDDRLNGHIYYRSVNGGFIKFKYKQGVMKVHEIKKNEESDQDTEKAVK
jgi:antitoxin component YwqK of YwqJK toxin-antitoxin module